VHLKTKRNENQQQAPANDNMKFLLLLKSLYDCCNRTIWHSASVALRDHVTSGH
jgi:hypothetical protein